MKSHFDRYFELLPALVIVLLLVLADGVRQMWRERAVGPVLIEAPEPFLETPRILIR